MRTASRPADRRTVTDSRTPGVRWHYCMMAMNASRATGARRALIGLMGILAAVLIVTSWATLAQAAASARRPEPVTFRNGSITLAGTLYLPAGRGRHPAVVVFHPA